MLIWNQMLGNFSSHNFGCPDNKIMHTDISQLHKKIQSRPASAAENVPVVSGIKPAETGQCSAEKCGGTSAIRMDFIKSFGGSQRPSANRVNNCRMRRRFSPAVPQHLEDDARTLWPHPLTVGRIHRRPMEVTEDKTSR